MDVGWTPNGVLRDDTYGICLGWFTWVSSGLGSNGSLAVRFALTGRPVT